MPMLKFTTEIVNAAILGMEARKEKLDAKIAELRALLPGGHAETAATPEAPTRRRRKFSAAAIKRMREAQQRRWAKVRGENAPAAAVAKPVATKPKRKLSKAGRAAIVAALKKRWAAKKAAAKKAAAKKTA